MIAEVLHATAHEYAATLGDLRSAHHALPSLLAGYTRALTEAVGELLHWSPSGGAAPMAARHRSARPGLAQKIASLDTVSSPPVSSTN